MKERVYARLKKTPEDFIVEEMQDTWKCRVSLPFGQNQKTEFPKQLLESPSKEFIWCEMVKKDIDHFQALKRTADKLDLTTRDIGYAGTKDRFAVTSQRISLHRPSLKKLREFSDSHIHLQNFKWNKRKIKLGYLDENHFTITLREIESKDAKKVAHNIRKTTIFPNYFGSQRFGSLRGNNVEIGKLLLKRKFKDAVMKILTDTSDKEPDHITKMRKKLGKEQDFKKALHYFPKKLRLEQQLLQHLARDPEDFLGALKRGERKNILFFVNAVQSKIFNKVLEQALEEGLDFTKKGHENCILPGYKTTFYNGRLGEIEKKVLSQENLKLSDFNIQELSFLRIKGSYRKAVTQVKDLDVEILDDELFKNAKKIVLSFTLPSGVYATTYLENFFLWT